MGGLARWDGSRSVDRRFAVERPRTILAGHGFRRGHEVVTLSSGDFSMVDWIEALVFDYVGPCHLQCATWGAAAADLKRVLSWIEDGTILSHRWFVDRSFKNRQPEIVEGFREHFGDENIRVGNIHAKFTLLQNDDWHVVAMTSANLNLASRIEMYHAADCPRFFEEFVAVFDAAWSAQKPCEGFDEGDGASRKPNAALKRDSMHDRAKREGLAVSSSIPLG